MIFHIWCILTGFILLWILNQVKLSSLGLTYILKALKGPPFKPLQSTSLRALSLKTALLLALVSVNWVGDLQALSINPACLEFGPNDSKVILKPRLGYVMYRLHSVKSSGHSASTLSPSTGSQLSLLCPVRALRVYIEHSASYGKSEQLFVGFGNRAKGGPGTKQGISRCLVDAITLAYSSLGCSAPSESEPIPPEASPIPGHGPAGCLWKFVRRPAGPRRPHL